MKGEVQTHQEKPRYTKNRMFPTRFPASQEMQHFAESPFVHHDLAIGKKFDPYAATILGLFRYKNFYWSSKKRLTNGFFYITINEIQVYTGYGITTIRQKINQMREYGLIEISRQMVNGDLTKRINHYKINYDVWMEISSEMGDTFYQGLADDFT